MAMGAEGRAHSLDDERHEEGEPGEDDRGGKMTMVGRGKKKKYKKKKGGAPAERFGGERNKTGQQQRKLPFSGKAKKAQLKSKRGDGGGGRSGDRGIEELEANGRTLVSQFGQDGEEASLHTVLERESEMLLRRRRERSMRLPLQQDENWEGELRTPEWPQTWCGGPESMPIRPVPRAGENVAEIEAREEALVRRWAETYDDTFVASSSAMSSTAYDDNDAGQDDDSNERVYFERNVNVWRQLWRVLEQSSVLLVLAPAGAPALQLPTPVLVEARRRRVPVICVLTKADMVTEEDVVEDWKAYVRTRFPDTLAGVVAVSADARRRSGEKGGSGRWSGSDGDGMSELLLRLADIQVENESWRGTIADLLQSGAIADAEAAAGTPESIILPESAAADSHETTHDANGIHHLPDDDIEDGEDVSPGEVGTQYRGIGVGGGDFDDGCDESPQAYRPSRATATISCSASGDSGRSDGEVLDLWSKASVWRRDRKMGKRRCAPASRAFAAIGVVGEPNVGKSALINRILGRSAAGVSNTPGKTKRLQTLFLAPQVALLDCPGLIFPKVGVPRALGVLCGNLAVSQCREPYSAIRLVCDLYTLSAVVRAHGMALPSAPISPFELMELFAEKWRFHIARSGRPDAARAANLFLRMILSGHPIALVVRPPHK